MKAWTVVAAAAALVSFLGCVPAEQKAFFLDVQETNLPRVKSGLENHPEWLDETNPQGWTPLCWAAYRDHKEMVEFLVARGADVNVPDKLGRAPLYWSADHGRKELVELLLAKGAEVDATDDYDRTALHMAVFRNHLGAAEALIAAGADVNAKADDDHTPLYIATREGHKEMADLLRKHGGKR